MDKVVFFLVSGLLLWWAFHTIQVNGRKVAAEKVRRIAEQHADALGQKWQETVRLDDYGREVGAAWNAECDYFLKNLILPQLDPSLQRSFIQKDWNTARATVGSIAKARAAELEAGAAQPAHPPPLASVAPHAYVEWCAATLRRVGWQVRIPQTAGGERDIDVIAEHNGIRVALQCRRSYQPIGDAAIRQVAAARMLVKADHAAILTTATSTPAIQQLAASSRVLLLHENQLPQLASLCGLTEPVAPVMAPPASPTASHPN